MPPIPPPDHRPIIGRRIQPPDDTPAETRHARPLDGPAASIPWSRPADRAPHAEAAPAIDSRSSALQWIHGDLSSPVPADSMFPHEVLPGWKLNFDNLTHSLDALSAQLQAVLPVDKSTAALHFAISGIPDRLVSQVRFWAGGHANSSMPQMPADQFNLRVADEFRCAYNAAERLAEDRHATDHQRAVAAELAPLLLGLKRLHYSSNVQTLYGAAGQRALPCLDGLDGRLAPGFERRQDVGVLVAGGAALESAQGTLQLTARVGLGRTKAVTIGDDRHVVVTDAYQFTVGGEAKGSVGGVFKATHGLDARFDVGQQFKAPTVEQARRLYVTRHQYQKPMITSAGPMRRDVTAQLARMGNGMATLFLTGEKQPFDPLAPNHATAAKAVKGLHGEAAVQSHAKALDELAGLAPSDGHPGPFEALLMSFYPSLKQRYAAMDDPRHWTAEQVSAHLPGNDPTEPGRVSSNKLAGTQPRPVPARRVNVTQRAEVGLGGAIAGTGLAPRLDHRLKATAYDDATHQVTRLEPTMRALDVGLNGDFAGVLSSLHEMQQRYAGAWHGEGVPPHLRLMDRFNAMKQLDLAPPSQRSPAHIDDGIYGNLRDAPPECRAAIAAVRSGRLAPLELLSRIDANLSDYALEHARFTVDASEAWAHRDSARGARILHDMNDAYFGGAVRLPARPTPDDFTAFFGRADDAHAMAVCNLGAQRSVALYEGVQRLSHASVEAQAGFQRQADVGAAVYQARVAAYNEHNLPLIKDQAWRNGSIALTGFIHDKERKVSASVALDTGILTAALRMTGLPDSGASVGTLAAELAFTHTQQLNAVNPLVEGSLIKIRFEGDGGAPFPQIAVAAHQAAMARSSTAASAAQIPVALLGEMRKASHVMPFGTRGGTIEANWRVPPDSNEPSLDGKAPPSGRALQYLRATAPARAASTAPRPTC